MNVALSNLDLEDKTELTRQILKSEAEDKRSVDIRREKTSDKEIAGLIRSGFSIGFVVMFQTYRIRWGRIRE